MSSTSSYDEHLVPTGGTALGSGGSAEGGPAICLHPFLSPSFMFYVLSFIFPVLSAMIQADPSQSLCHDG